MTSATALNLKLVECCCATAVPRTLFAAISKPSCSSLSIRQIHFPSSSIALKSSNLPSKIVPFVAQTSDWAQQDEEAIAAEGDVADDEEGDVADDEEGDVADDEEDADIDGGISEPPEEAKLFVGNLPYDVDSEKLAGLFNQAGVVEISEVIYNRQTDQSRGFGFVTMSTVEEAEKAVEMFSGYDVDGRLLTVNKAAPRGSQPERVPRVYQPSFRIYVGNLPWRADDARLVDVFSEYGKVVDARVVYDQQSGRSRGFGFVTMSTESEVNDAIAALDGQELDGRAIRVNVAEERPRRTF